MKMKSSRQEVKFGNVEVNTSNDVTIGEKNVYNHLHHQLQFPVDPPTNVAQSSETLDRLHKTDSTVSNVEQKSSYLETFMYRVIETTTDHIVPFIFDLIRSILSIF